MRICIFGALVAFLTCLPGLNAQTGIRSAPTDILDNASRRNIEKDWLDLDSSGNAPSLTVSVPTGFAGDGLSAYIGISFVDRVRYSDVSDGALTLGLSGGDPDKYVGFSLAATAYDTYGSTFGKSIGFHAGISRMLTGSISLSLGANNIVLSSEAEAFQILSAYLVATKVLKLRDKRWFSWASLTLGVGNGSYNSENTTNQIVLNELSTPGADEKNWENYRVFGGLSLAVLPRLNFIANWTGQDLDAGLSIIPFSKLGIVVTGAALDVTENAGDGIRWGGNIGYTYQIK